MNPQKVKMTTKQALKQCSEDKECPWTQEKCEITLMNKEDQNTSTATYTDIWQENTRS